MKNKLLEQLIAIKSYSGEEGNLKKFIADWFNQKGIKTISQGDNLLVHIKGKNDKKAFIFNSHMDTVSAGDEALWEYGPWNPTYVGDKLIGLGASDMKSGLAASMLICEKFAKEKPSIDLWFTFVVKEEQDGSGTMNFATWFKENGHVNHYKEMAGIFTEPTSLSGIDHGHRGNLFIYAKTTGDSGHASRPKMNKTHAVKIMIDFSLALEKEVAKWQKEYKSEIFDPPTVGLFTSIYAGVRNEGKGLEVESPNKFPASCKATFDVRTVPGFHEVALEKITLLGKKMGVEVGLEFPAAPSGFTDPGDRLVRLAKGILGKAKLSVSQGSADLGFLSELGVKGIILGPGDKSQSHRVNEYCSPEQVEQAVKIYAQIVSGWSDNP